MVSKSDARDGPPNLPRCRTQLEIIPKSSWQKKKKATPHHWERTLFSGPIKTIPRPPSHRLGKSIFISKGFVFRILSNLCWPARPVWSGLTPSWTCTARLPTAPAFCSLAFAWPTFEKKKKEKIKIKKSCPKYFGRIATSFCDLQDLCRLASYDHDMFAWSCAHVQSRMHRSRMGLDSRPLIACTVKSD